MNSISSPVFRLTTDLLMTHLGSKCAPMYRRIISALPLNSSMILVMLFNPNASVSKYVKWN